MSAKVWYLPYFEGVFHTQMIRMFANANAQMVRMLHTMIQILCANNKDKEANFIISKSWLVNQHLVKN